ncbi:MAG: methyltransferase domain-containing protein [Venatoribacter sp.]
MPKLDIFPEDHMHFAYGLFLLKPSHPLIRKMRKSIRPNLFGQKTWASSFLAIDYLQEHPLPKQSKVLELGCGWAPIAVYCAQQGCKATGMDIDEQVFPYMDVLANTNDVKVKALHSSFAELSPKQLAKFDALVGADICFWENLIDELMAMFERAQEAGVQQIIIADPGRSTFSQLCDACEATWPNAFSHSYWYSLEPNRAEGQVLHLDFRHRR